APEGDVAPGRVDQQASTQRVVSADVAQHDVSVSDGGLLPAEAVARRPWYGAGALRTDLQEAASVHPCDAAAPGPDLSQIDHRDPYRFADPTGATHLGPDAELPRDIRLTIADDAGLGRRPTHIKGDD